MDGPAPLRRKVAAVWRPSHVRNLIVSRTYMGEHVFGKRGAGARPPIVRAVPALVAEDTWQAAQQVLRAHRGGGSRAASQAYLLRGLMYCGICGLRYTALRARGPRHNYYYRCNGRQFAQALYGSREQRCAGRGIAGRVIEQLVWDELVEFLREPRQILKRLRQRLTLGQGEQRRRQRELAEKRAQLREKAAARERVVGLFRRGRIDEASLDRHLDGIDAESAELQSAIGEAEQALSSGERQAQMRVAEALLHNLREQLQEPPSPALQRQLIEALVGDRSK